jgi:hypothetical protein
MPPVNPAWRVRFSHAGALCVRHTPRFVPAHGAVGPAFPRFKLLPDEGLVPGDSLGQRQRWREFTLRFRVDASSDVHNRSPLHVIEQRWRTMPLKIYAVSSGETA